MACCTSRLVLLCILQGAHAAMDDLASKTGNLTCNDVKKEFQIQGCCGMPTKDFVMPGAWSAWDSGSGSGSGSGSVPAPQVETFYTDAACTTPGTMIQTWVDQGGGCQLVTRSTDNSTFYRKFQCIGGGYFMPTWNNGSCTGSPSSNFTLTFEYWHNISTGACYPAGGWAKFGAPLPSAYGEGCPSHRWWSKNSSGTCADMEKEYLRQGCCGNPAKTWAMH